MVRNDLLIVGAGPVGLALALALKDSGLDIAVADARTPQAASTDPRVLALAWGTRLTLERLGVWADLPATAIHTIHVSHQGGFGRTLLDAAEHDLPALGYVMPAGALARALRAAVEASGIAVLDETEVTALAPGAQDVIASLGGAGAVRHGPTRSARLVACAEGGLSSGDRNVCTHEYAQDALLARVQVEGGHRHAAFERFTPDGPLALLPLDDAYALVHAVPSTRADELMALDAATYLEHLQQRLGMRVRLTGIEARKRYPLGLRFRPRPAGQRTVWLGNAAQTLHPVAGQGFNLALRDVWALAEIVARRPDDPGAPEPLAAYARARRLDRFGAIGFTDLLVRTFSTDSAPLRHLRGAGLFALDTLPPLRHFLARRMMFGARAWP